VFRRDDAVQASDSTVQGFDQPMRVAGLAWGPVQALGWQGKARHVDFFDVKGDVQAMLAPRQAKFLPAEHPALHPGLSAQVVLDGVVIGHVGELHPRWRQSWDLPHPPVVFELNLDAVLARDVPVSQGVSKFQAVERDLALIVAESITHDALMQAIEAAPTLGLLRQAVLFDIYRPKTDAGGAVGQGEKSVAVRVTLQSEDASLTDAQIDSVMQALVEHLGSALNARLRS